METDVVPAGDPSIVEVADFLQVVRKYGVGEVVLRFALLLRAGRVRP